MDLSKPSLGTHILMDHFGGTGLTDTAMIESALKGAAQAAGATVLTCNLHKFGGHGGVTGVLMLAESHISIHTWPEEHYAAIDIFMCGAAQPEQAAAFLERALAPEKVVVTRVARGSAKPVLPPV